MAGPVIIGRNTFGQPTFYTEGPGVDLYQDRYSSALTISSAARYVTPEQFGPNGTWTATETATAFQAAADYCSENGYDFVAQGDYTLNQRIEFYPQKSFNVILNGSCTWPASSASAGFYCEPTSGGGWPSFFSDNGNFITGDTTHTLLEYNNVNNIAAANKDRFTYALSPRDGAIVTIRGFNAEGASLTGAGWYNGIIVNALGSVCIEGNRVTGQKQSATVAGVQQSITGISGFGIASRSRDYDARTITNISVDVDGVVTVTWSGGTAFQPTTPAFVYFTGIAGDLGHALNGMNCRIKAVSASTFTLTNFDGSWLPAYTSGGTFEGAPQYATVEIKHNKVQWYEYGITCDQVEGRYIEDNRLVGCSTGMQFCEQLSVEAIGHNFINTTWRGIHCRNVGGFYSAPGLIFGNKNPIFLAGLTITKGATTTGSWTSGTTMPWEMQNDTWVSFVTTTDLNNVLDMSRASTCVVTVSNIEDFSNGDDIVITGLKDEWADTLGRKIEAVVAGKSGTTGQGTFNLTTDGSTGIDTSAITVAYLDTLNGAEGGDGEEAELEYATCSGGMFDIVDEFYMLKDVNRTARTFRIVYAEDETDVDSSTWNNWTAGRMQVVTRPIVLERVRGVRVDGWSIGAVGDTLNRSVELIDCKVSSGSFVDRNIFKGKIYAAVELSGLTDYFTVGDIFRRPSNVVVNVWDRTTKYHNIYSNRRQLLPQTFSSSDNNISGTGMSVDYSPSKCSVKFNYAGTLALGAIVNRSNFIQHGVVNSTEPDDATSGLLIFEAMATGQAKVVCYDRSPRFLLPGAHMDFVYDEDVTRWWPLDSTRWRSVFDVFDDMFTATALPSGASGTATSVAVSTYGVGDTTPKAMGVVEIATGTDTTGSAHMGPIASTFRMNQGCSLFVARVAIADLSTAGQEYKIRIGWHDAAAGTANVTDGVYYEYDRTSNTAWLLKASTAGTTTTATSSRTVAVTDFITFGIFINGNGTRADFFHWLDGDDITVETSITTNIPTGTNRCGFGVSIHKTAGTTSRSAYVDYIGMTMLNARGH